MQPKESLLFTDAGSVPRNLVADTEIGIYRLDKEVLEKVRRWFANGLEKKREREAS